MITRIEKRMKTALLTSPVMCVLLGACSQVAGPESLSSLGSGSASVRYAAPSKSYSVSQSQGVSGLVKLMNRHHPALLAADAEVERLRHQAVVAGALPDPKAKLTGGRLAETAAGRMEAIVGVEQKLPYPGKLSLRKKKVLKLAEAAKDQREVLRVQLAYQLRVAYWQYYEVRHTRKLLRENQQLLKQLTETVQVRVEANQAQSQDLIRLTNEVGKIERQIVLLNKRESQVKASLNALLHRPQKSSLPLPKFDTQDLRVNLAATVSSHPELSRGRNMMLVAEHEQSLAKLANKPDFNIGLQYGSVNGSGLAPSSNGRDQVMATFGVTLPIWEGKNTAKRKAAEANVAKYTSQLEATRDLLESERTASSADMSAQKSLIKLFKNQLIPDSQTAFELTTTSYANSKASFNDLIDAWRQLLQQQTLQVKNQSSLGVATARFKKSTAR